MRWRHSIIRWIALAVLVSSAARITARETTQEVTARQLVTRAFEAYRSKASVARLKMTIHRPDWERTQILRAWTEGEKKTLVTTVDPVRDRGNGTLKIDDDMWVYNPRVNRVIKLPPSMMAQSWMGSDFSNNDLAKSDSILNDYTHRIIGKTTDNGQVVYTVESDPKRGAAVVWGKQVLRIREDGAFLEEIFYDEDGKVVKTLTFGQISDEDGLPFAHVLTMTPNDKPGHYTRIDYLKVAFPGSLPKNVFTRESLKDPPPAD